jgi:hypothetical protein
MKRKSIHFIENYYGEREQATSPDFILGDDACQLLFVLWSRSV